MNAYLKWFSIVTWIGVPINLYFAVPALFVPEYLIDTLDLNKGFDTIWLRNAGLLIFIITWGMYPFGSLRCSARSGPKRSASNFAGSANTAGSCIVAYIPPIAFQPAGTR